MKNPKKLILGKTLLLKIQKVELQSAAGGVRNRGGCSCPTN